MSTIRTITIALVDPYDDPAHALDYPVIGRAEILAYVHGAIAAHPTPIATGAAPGNWTVSHVPTGGALQANLSMSDALALMRAWAPLGLERYQDQETFRADRETIWLQLQDAAADAGYIIWPPALQ